MKKWHEVMRGLDITVAVATAKEKPALRGPEVNLNDLFPVSGIIKNTPVTKYHLGISEDGLTFGNPITDADTMCIAITFRVHKYLVGKTKLSRRSEEFKAFEIKVPENQFYGYVQLLYWPIGEGFPQKFEPVQINGFGSVGMNYIPNIGKGRIYLNKK